MSRNMSDKKFQSAFSENPNISNIQHIENYADTKMTGTSTNKSSVPFNGQISSTWSIKRRLSSCDYERINQAANASVLRLKAQNVSNKSI